MIDLKGKDQSWWPVLDGKTVAILAAGPSMTQAQADVVRDADWWTCAINESWRLALKADALYGCDWQWWRRHPPLADAYRGLRVVGTVPNGPNKKPYLPSDMKWQMALLHHVPVRAGTAHPIWQGREIGAGSNSAFQAVNWLVRCGAKRVVLLGVDCHSPNRHWHGNHCFPEVSHQKSTLMERWRIAWRNMAKELKPRGVECVNCSPGTACDAFPLASVETIAERWHA